jgi:MFS transporter, Spinster family, sphingosine-1-phosphate transporter
MLTNFQDGCLPAAFMVGLLVACPIFVQLAKTVQTFKLVGIGLLIWFLSVFASGLSWDFWSLLFFRTAVGAGEASFVILAAPFIGTLHHLLKQKLLNFDG